MKVNQPTWRATNKMVAGALSGAVMTVLLWAVQTFAPLVTVPRYVEEAIVVIVAYAVAYMTRNEYVPQNDPSPGMERLKEEL